tara:strand:+ start:170 stop:520 length:351 start_codon:yes stop_codon:yes gene_type:complete
MTTLIRIAEADELLYPTSVIPKAVPAAGGCSKSNTTINSIVIPTEAENQTALKKRISIKGNTAKQDPTKKPTRCPPMIRFGSAATLLGIANTINAVAPILATTTGLLDNKMEIKSP